MRRARATLEEQLGGLIDRAERRERRRATSAPPPERFPLTVQGTLAIRAARAADEPARAQVA